MIFGVSIAVSVALMNRTLLCTVLLSVCSDFNANDITRFEIQ